MLIRPGNRGGSVCPWSDHVVLQLLQRITCLPPIDSPIDERGGYGPEHGVEEDADTEGVKHGVPPWRLVPRVSGSVSVQEVGGEEVQPAKSSGHISREERRPGARWSAK